MKRGREKEGKKTNKLENKINGDKTQNKISYDIN